MIESVRFQSFKALRDATLPLGGFTLIVGPNGSGKSTAIRALGCMSVPNAPSGMLGGYGGTSSRRMAPAHRATLPQSVATLGVPLSDVALTLRWGHPCAGAITKLVFQNDGRIEAHHQDVTGTDLDQATADRLQSILQRVRIYSLNADAIMAPTPLQPGMELGEDGANLAGVLTQLRDREPERFEALAAELMRWLPEFDRILLDTTPQGQRFLALRTRQGRYAIAADDLSQGTLLALAMLTLAHLPAPPPIVCFEEPDRGLHPRLLRDVRDAMYRLSYPEHSGEKREPVQVVATTHSPYLLDLFRDHPEEVVIAEKTGHEAHFERLVDRKDLDEILESGHLGDIWYSGVLGGVPSEP